MKKSTVVMILLLLPLAVGGLLGYNIGRTSAEPPTNPSQYEGAPFQEAAYTPGGRDSINDSITNSRHNAITETVARVSPAVVGINVTEVRQYRQWSPWGDDPFFRQFFGDRVYTQKVQSLGSGFIISQDGYILTNDHVAGNAKEITVTLTSGDKYKATLVGTDHVSDVALLKIDATNLPLIRLGNSDDVITGEWVIALGNPFGLFDIGDKWR